MAICAPCKEAQHEGCEDWDPIQLKKRKPKFVLKQGRLYRSCDCQHAGMRVTDEPLGDPTDC